MKKVCPFLVVHKETGVLGPIYKCVLAKALLRPKHLQEAWACNGCQIPNIMRRKLCRHLKPHKSFIIKGSSTTWFSCELFGIIISDPLEFCTANCKTFEVEQG